MSVNSIPQRNMTLSKTKNRSKKDVSFGVVNVFDITGRQCWRIIDGEHSQFMRHISYSRLFLFGFYDSGMFMRAMINPADDLRTAFPEKNHSPIIFEKVKREGKENDACLKFMEKIVDFSKNLNDTLDRSSDSLEKRIGFLKRKLFINKDTKCAPDERQWFYDVYNFCEEIQCYYKKKK